MNQFDPYATSNSSSATQPQGQGYNANTSNATACTSQQPGTTSNPNPSSSLLNQNQIQFFLNQGYTKGLLNKLLHCKTSYFQRCYIVDNGHGMLVQDSHKLLINHENHGSIESMDGIRRWDELLESISTQAWISSYLEMSMRFALLNKPANMTTQYFTMGESDDINKSPQEKVQKIGQILKSIQPNGPTNLTKQVQTIHAYVSSITNQLQSTNQKISVVIATQGLPTNDNGESNPTITQEFVDALTKLSSLPVSIILRLCTDDEHVFHFYDDSFHHMEAISQTRNHHIEFDIIDDYSGEALEVFLKNPWLTYGLSLHRFRELGLFVNVLASLDDHLLTFDELYEFCSIIFESTSTIPHPKTQWTLFLQTIDMLMQKETKQWNPVKKNFTPWINVFQLKQMYEKQLHHHQQQQQQQQQQPFHTQQGGQYSTQNSTNSFNGSTNYDHQQSTANSIPPQPKQPPLSQPPTSTSTDTSTAQQPPVQTSSAPPLDEASIKKHLLMTWALQAPAYQALKLVTVLLATVQIAFPPAFGVDEHSYFQKWKILSLEGMSSGSHSVVKRAYRKAKFLLHPDKLPKDLNEKQLFVCKLIWDVLADAWGIYEQNNSL